MCQRGVVYWGGGQAGGRGQGGTKAGRSGELRLACQGCCELSLHTPKLWACKLQMTMRTLLKGHILKTGLPWNDPESKKTFKEHPLELRVSG